VEQLDAAKALREAATKDVKPALLVKYERIRRGRAPAALYPLHQDACGHCHTAVPLQRRVLIQQGQSIEGCEVCGVLLYAAG
jgi:predicted  nucleic acid-binding Zn-ribbon protein